MNPITIIAVVVVVGALGFAVYKNNTSAAQSTLARPATYAELKDSLAHGALLVDVRTAAEFASQHVRGAKNVSLQAIQAGTYPTGNKDTPLYIYCHSGNRARQAIAILKSAGYTRLASLGGIADMQRLGAPF